jgi:hypothetical protein
MQVAYLSIEHLHVHWLHCFCHCGCSELRASPTTVCKLEASTAVATASGSGHPVGSTRQDSAQKESCQMYRAMSTKPAKGSSAVLYTSCRFVQKPFDWCYMTPAACSTGFAINIMELGAYCSGIRNPRCI